MKTALQFSGGKDSLACLYLYRDMWPSLTVAWVNTGAAYPETVAYMDHWRTALPNFVEIKSDQPGQIKEFGWPSDVVPVMNTPVGRMVSGGDRGVRVQSCFECCAANIWRPMHEAMQRLGIQRIIRGQRNADKRRSPIRSGHVEDGVEYIFPLEGWSEAEVFEYLAREEAVMPPGYAAGERTSRDCWDCTAYLDDHESHIRSLPAERRAVVLHRIAAMHNAIRCEPMMRMGAL